MRPGWRLGAAFGCSLVLHLLLATLIQLPVRSLDAVSEALHVLLVPLAPPAPVPAPPPLVHDPKAASRAKPPPKAKPQRQAKAQASSPSPAPPPAQPRAPSVSASLVSVPRHVPDSELADVSGYYPSNGLTRAPSLDGPLPVQYPARSFAARRRGVVVLQLMIDESGRVAEALPVPGASEEEFVEAALAGVRKARFRPGELGGRAVPVRAYLAVHFVIE
jgi:protein TonB